MIVPVVLQLNGKRPVDFTVDVPESSNINALRLAIVRLRHLSGTGETLLVYKSDRAECIMFRQTTTVIVPDPTKLLLGHEIVTADCNYFCQEESQGQSISWTSIELSTACFDQSHLISNQLDCSVQLAIITSINMLLASIDYCLITDSQSFMWSSWWIVWKPFFSTLSKHLNLPVDKFSLYCAWSYKLDTHFCIVRFSVCRCSRTRLVNQFQSILYQSLLWYNSA